MFSDDMTVMFASPITIISGTAAAKSPSAPGAS
jgi:hypothetical protein